MQMSEHAEWESMVVSKGTEVENTDNGHGLGDGGISLVHPCKPRWFHTCGVGGAAGR